MIELDNRKEDAKTKETIEIRASQVIAGALAAITAAVLGSTLGVAGTVLGAGIASIVTTVGATLYLHSIQRTKQGVRTVRARVVGGQDDDEVQHNNEAQDEDDKAQPDAPTTRRRPGWAALLAGSVLAFALGMLVITGVEWLRGEPLSGGQGTTIGGIVDPRPGAARDELPVDRSTSEPSPPAEQTTTPTPPPSGSTTPSPTGQPTGSTTPPTTTTSSTAPGTGSSPPSVRDPAGP